MWLHQRLAGAHLLRLLRTERGGQHVNHSIGFLAEGGHFGDL